MVIRRLIRRAETRMEPGSQAVQPHDRPGTVQAASLHANECSQRPAPVAEFVVWLVQAGEVDNLSRRRLWCLYLEFCEYSESPPLTELQLLRRIRAAGIERFRETTGERRWFYRVRAADVVHLNQAGRSP